MTELRINAEPLSPAEFRHVFDSRLGDYSNELEQQAMEVTPELGEMIAYVNASIRAGGKRLRPYLTYLGYTGHGGLDVDRALDVGIASEIYHTYLLIHDDVIDRDLMRHGHPNVISRYSEAIKSKGVEEKDAEEASAAMGILAGDVVFGIAFQKILHNPEIDDATKVRMLKTLTEVNLRECAGQQLDIMAPLLSHEQIDEDYVIRTYSLKTSPYSFYLPLKFGLMLAGAKPEDVEYIQGYAEPAGVAFQIADDLIGMYGEEETAGKSVVSDLQEGKLTLLMLNGLKMADASDRRLLLSYLGDPKADVPQLLLVRKIMEKSGAKARTLQTARELVTEAKQALDSTNMLPSAKQRLSEITDSLIDRVN